MDIERKLATIRTISKIEPIDGADLLELCHIDGWQCVVTKGKHQPAERVVYFEIDSFLPNEPQYEFLRKSCFKSVEGLGEGFRIKTIKLRGQLSQGLVMSLADLYLRSDLPDGDDVTAVLGVKKYEKPVPSQLRGQMAGSFPPFIPKTDQERVQNCYRKLDKEAVWEATIKLDGTSLTAYTHEGKIGVCSRNYELKDDGNAYWEAAKACGLIDILEALRECGNSLAFQGELMGPGIQGNRENLFEKTFFLFDIYDISDREYMIPEDRIESANIYGIKHAPIIGHLTIGNRTIDDILAISNRASLNNPVAEGVVWKRLDGKDSFKAINNKFLLKEKD